MGEISIQLTSLTCDSRCDQIPPMSTQESAFRLAAGALGVVAAEHAPWLTSLLVAVRRLASSVLHSVHPFD